MLGGLTRDIEAGVDRWTAGGQVGHFGLAQNAAMTGLFESFQGKTFSVFTPDVDVPFAAASLTYSRLITAATIPHIMNGGSQYSVVYASEAAIASGFPNANNSIRTSYADGALIVGETYTILSTGDSNFVLAGAASNTVGVVFVATNVGVAGKTGVCTFLDVSPTAARGLLRMNLLQTVAGKQGVSLIQGNALWISAISSFKAYFDINYMNRQSDVKAISFVELGVVGSQGTLLNSTDAAAEIGATSNFIQLQFASGKCKLRVRTVGSATIRESAAFDYPRNTPFTCGFEYNINNSVGNIIVRINDRVVATMQATMAGSLQTFARTCHGASYDPTLHTQKILEIDTVLVSVPTAG